MTDAEWSRQGTHSEHGRYTVERWLEIYAAHAHDHADADQGGTRRGAEEDVNAARPPWTR